MEPLGFDSYLRRQENRHDSNTIELIECVGCDREIKDDEHNYGTPELPVCIQCYNDANEEGIS